MKIRAEVTEKSETKYIITVIGGELTQIRGLREIQAENKDEKKYLATEPAMQKISKFHIIRFTESKKTYSQKKRVKLKNYQKHVPEIKNTSFGTTIKLV